MHTFRENLNSHRFLQILLNEIIPSVNELYPTDGFLEENSPSHQRKAKTYIHENLGYQPMPARSPHANPIRKYLVCPEKEC